PAPIPTIPPPSLHDALPICTIATGPRITSLTQQVLGQGLIRVLKTSKAEEFMAAVLTFMADTRARAGEVNAWQAKAIPGVEAHLDRKSTRLNSSHVSISYAV